MAYQFVLFNLGDWIGSLKLKLKFIPQKVFKVKTESFAHPWKSEWKLNWMNAHKTESRVTYRIIQCLCNSSILMSFQKSSLINNPSCTIYQRRAEFFILSSLLLFVRRGKSRIHFNSIESISRHKKLCKQRRQIRIDFHPIFAGISRSSELVMKNFICFALCWKMRGFRREKMANIMFHFEEYCVTRMCLQ